LKNRAEPPTLQHTKSPLPSPPRPAGVGEEGDEDHAGSPAAPRTCTDEELRLPPILPRSQVRLPFPRPPRPARRQRRTMGKVRIRRQQTAGKLFRGLAASSTTSCSSQRSQKATAVSPTVQIPPRSRLPLPGREPKLQRERKHLHLSCTEGPAPLLRLPLPATPARSALDRPGAPAGTLKGTVAKREEGEGKVRAFADFR
jgi:hypothetical protein